MVNKDLGVESIMSKKLVKLEPYLEKIEIVLLDRLVTPFMRFRLQVKASGSDLPCDGRWFHIIVVDQEMPEAIIISQPQGKVIGFGMTGEWVVELQAPLDKGSYWLQVSTVSVETNEPVIKIPLIVKPDSKRKSQATIIKKFFLPTAVFISALALIWFLFPIEMKTAQKGLKKTIDTKSLTVPISKRVEKASKEKKLEDKKTEVFVDEMLEQSFNHASVTMRQEAWLQLSQFIESQESADNPFVIEIRKKRLLHKQQMEKWLKLDKNPQELFKRMLVLAFVDDDENAQRQLGGYYASGANENKNLGEAWRWYQRAANKGNAEAKQLLIRLEAYADQLLKSPVLKNRIRGYEVTEVSASAGGINSQLWMGYRYEVGDGVESDLMVAASWYRKAAEQGNALAGDKLKKILDLMAKEGE